MPIKDIIHVYECKFCKQKWTMFDSSDGGLLYFPEKTIRPVHGEYELLYHLKHKHFRNYDADMIFYNGDSEAIINANFHKSKAEVIK